MSGDVSRRLAKIAGVPAKHVILMAIVVQNSALVLLLHYSRTMPLVNGVRFYPSIAVLLSEVLKFSFFLSMALYEIATGPQTLETSTIGELAGALSRAVLSNDSWRLGIPAAIFTLQNSLQYVAASNLDATTFSTTFQIKIVSTAVFGILLLGRALDTRKWLALGLTAFAVGVVQTSYVSSQGRVLSIKDLRDGVSFSTPRSIWDMEAEGNEAAGQLNKRSATYEGIDQDFAAANPRMNASVGLAAAVAASVLSGLACVYLERVLKTRSETGRTSVWVRNVQLSFYSIWPALFLGVFLKDGEHLSKTGFFAGMNWVVWAVVLLQAAGGVLVALALSHADSMAKSFATSVSTVVVFLASVCFAEAQTPTSYLLGVLGTSCAAFVYNSAPDEKKLRPPPINISQYDDDKSSEAGYFDIEAIATGAKSPIRDPLREGLSSSRPGTPVSERRHYRSKSTELRFAKRGQ